ncbi:hypothetical protein KAX08_02525 [candidate division WOR-3 bacterium]|nr:hypothetical protein [candidate division WOR-3 bacterium]
MKEKLFILFFIPLLIFAHINDERLFRTTGNTCTAMILLDRSGSMSRRTWHYDMSVMLNDYSANVDTLLNGWYDTDISPIGPGAMSDFVGASGNGVWVLDIEWKSPALNRLNLSWTLNILSGGTWHTYDGGSYSWTGYGKEDTTVTIGVTGLGQIQEVECYLNITTHEGLTIGGTQITLGKAPYLFPGKSTRIQDAIIVIFSLLDANYDKSITLADEKLLPVDLGYGFFVDATVYLPPDASGWADRGLSFNENTEQWEKLGEGRLCTDTLGSHFADIWDNVNFTRNASTTPNGVMIARTVDYINNWSTSHPILWCMIHNIILITDGETNNPREECGESGSKDVVRQAYRAWHENSVKVHAVGFGQGIDDDAANELNWVGRWGGTQSASDETIDSLIGAGMDTSVVTGLSCLMEEPRDHFLSGYAYLAKNAEELSHALAKIFGQIIALSSVTFTTGEVTSVEEEFLSTQYQSRLYFASFIPDTLPIWNGNLKAIRLDTGEFDLDSIPPEIMIWSAKDSLKVDKLADARNIYGIKSNGNMLPFNTANFDYADLDVSSQVVADSVIDRVRDGIEDDNRGELGDIFHSSPLRIHSPNYFYVDQGFNQFFGNMKDRSAILYAGANDGMLHVFADSINGQGGRGGEEIAGIIPMNFIPKVKNLLVGHEYYVDANPVAADVWFPESDDDSVKQWNEWHTFLLACQGEGGRSFTAFNVTDPLGETSHPMDSIAFLFDGMQSNVLKDTLGYTTSTPVIHKVGVNWTGHSNRTIDRFYAFMGGGQWPEPMDISLLDSVFSGGEVEGNVIIGVDVWKATKNGINGNFYLIPPISRDATWMNMPFPATPGMINIDPEKGNRFDLLFIPDASGKLWFVDVRNLDPSTWKAECIFVPPLPASSDPSELLNWHPAFHRPLLWKDPVYGDYWIAYGTGNRSDIFIPSNDRFYCLKYPAQAFEDTTIAIPVYGEGDLGVPGNPTDAGWMLELQHLNEKVITQAIYYQDSLKFSTFSTGIDTVPNPCVIALGSIARSYTFDIRTGGTVVIGGTIIGSGIPQSPRYSYSLGGKGMKITQVLGKMKIEETKGFKSYKEIIKWKEE